jgi:hypothetical protein
MQLQHRFCVVGACAEGDNIETVFFYLIQLHKYYTFR